MKTINLCFISCAFLLSSCAGVKFYSDQNLKSETGLIVYPPRPYILETVYRTYPNSKDDSYFNDTINVSHIYLADIKNPIYIKQISGIGTSDLQIDQSSGFLKSYGLSIDTKIPETINSISAAATGVLKSVRILEENAKSPRTEAFFKLYEITIDPNDKTRTILREVKIEDLK
ncbi:hypothetical protein [uncultured Bacteroides sp.]|uniref:hypothetical protein n=1 Tax=uncultured Bacteroides sp. TaxID=162156 RepID=UPI002AAC25E3|nr:hypothetical protein [uncultured Bacteroides sp.]